MVVAVIDRGIDQANGRLRECVFEPEITLGNNPFDSAHLGHGTSVACIIHGVAPQAKILSFKLTSIKEKVDVEQLCEAIEICREREDVKILNISMGLLQAVVNPKLELACRKCIDAGKIIVAAVHNDLTLPCFPAALPDVLGVGTGIVRAPDKFCYLGDGYINILAKGVHQLVLDEKMQPVIRSGTSYACAAFSAIAANLLRGNTINNINDFRNILKSKSDDSIFSVHYPIGRVENNEFRPNIGNEIFLKSSCIAFPTDDPWICSMLLSDNVKMVMLYPADPSNQFSAGISNTKRQIPAVLSHKLWNHVDSVLLGNFLFNPNLINIYFGYDIIDLALSNNGNIFLNDDYLFGIVKRRVENRSGFKGEIKLLNNNSCVLPKSIESSEL